MGIISPTLLYEFVFEPLNWVSGTERARLQHMLLTQRNGMEVFPGTKALRRRETWALELPLGSFVGNFDPAIATPKDDLAHRLEVTEAAKNDFGSYGFDRWRHVFRKNDVWYYKKAALLAFRGAAFPNEIFAAAFHFLLAAEKDPTLIKGPPPRRCTPVAERPLINGRRARGPAWTSYEDTLLRNWFGRKEGPKGLRHAPLTEPQWVMLLDRLEGLRTRQAVLDRLRLLNAALKRTMMVDGYIPQDRLQAFMNLCLGEKTYMPRYRERVFGTYSGRPLVTRKRRTDTP